MFRCESILLKTHWVMVVMDQYTRRIIGFAVHFPNLIAKNIALVFLQQISRYAGTDQLHMIRNNLKRFLNRFCAVHQHPYGAQHKPSLLLRRGELVVFESLLINEYIEDAFPEPPLLPDDPNLRAEARKWMHYCDQRLTPAVSRVFTSAEGSERKEALAAMSSDFDYL